MAEEVIPIRPRRGHMVHVTALTGRRLNRTLCGRDCRGWVVDEGPVSCLKCLEMTKLNRPLKQDTSGKWRTKCSKLADDLGWPRPAVYEEWRQMALQVEYEGRVVRALAEIKAWELIESSLCKQGSENAS